jgi:glucosylceramidase
VTQLCMVVLLAAGASAATASPEGGDASRSVEVWLTKPDRSALCARQPERVPFTDDAGRGTAIVVDEGQRFQTMDGFGFALTGGSAELMAKMSPAARAALLRELFATDGAGLGISYLRLTIGASDLNRVVFSYDDLPPGETDFPLEHFSLSRDLADVVPVMREILAVSPGVRVLGSPWSAPPWMKTNGDVRGGSLRPDCYEVYARYLVRYVQAMAREGIAIDAITVQNEPLNSRNTPSLQMLPAEQRDLVRDHVGPAFRAAGLATKILLFDHNLDRIDYPLTTLRDPQAAQYVEGTAFHHYGGDFTAMALLHEARPDKGLYFTEQMIVEPPGRPTIDIAPPVKRLVVAAPRHWSRNVLLWNLAADPNNDPHTDNGGCSMCQGAVTLDGDAVTRNLAYYTIAHASRFVPPGSARIASTGPDDRALLVAEDEERAGALRVGVKDEAGVPPNVAFLAPNGRIALVVVNDASTARTVTVQHRGRFATVRLEAGAVATLVW